MSEVYDLRGASETAPAERVVPERVTLAYLLDGVSGYLHSDFEEWAESFHGGFARRYELARVRLWTQKRLGVAAEVLEVERERLATWGAQVLTAQPLIRACSEDCELDYTDPAVLKYFALWLWVNDRAGEDTAAHSALVSGPLDWSLYLADDLLSLPGFAQ